MKQQVLYIAFASLSISLSLRVQGQITIGNIEKQEPKKALTTPKPKTLDSLSDFHVEESWANYKQYFGDYHFYLPPQAGNNNPTLWSTNSKKADSPFDNYYKLIGWVKDSTLKSRTQDDKIYYYHSENFKQISRYPALFQKMYFVMKSKKDGDTLYWAPNNKNEFILVPYFVKQKALYENKIFYYEGPSDKVEDLVNVSHTINIEPKSKWICKEVSLLKGKQVSMYGEDKYQICYRFTNDKNETFAKTLNPFFDENRDSRTSIAGKCFITEKEFLEKENAIKKDHQMYQQEKEARTAKENQDAKEKYAEHITKYGQANADLIKNGKVKLGFNKAMCLAAWGPFITPAKTVNDEGTFETWTYKFSPNQVLYFKNDILIQIEQ